MVLIKNPSIKKTFLEKRRSILKSIEDFIVSNLDEIITSAQSNDYSLFASLEEQFYQENSDSGLPTDLIIDLDSYVHGKLDNEKGKILYVYARDPAYTKIKQDKKLP